MVEVDAERFDAMVSEVLDGIPAELGDLMSNVAVTVRHEGGPAGLLGSTGSAVDASIDVLRWRPAGPDRDLPACICAVCDSEDEVVEQVRRTVIHEVGHHFGIGDARLRELRS